MAKLYVVPTPVGNLNDMTFRAIEVLKNADLILAEDTRTSSKLLNHFEIQNKLQSYHMHNEHKIVQSTIEKILSEDLTYALISDAGTPAISDPGFLIVRECVKNNIEIECLPGATAFVPALVLSGLPCDKFVFEGFLPHKKGRKTLFEQIELEKKTTILYESPHRLVKTLTQIKEFMGYERQVSVSREISKLHEQTVRGTVEEVLIYFTKNPNKVKGEIVLIVGGKNN
jgi:16S rRNA (cytidine1402-2'-O)-methyltransferase